MLGGQDFSAWDDPLDELNAAMDVFEESFQLAPYKRAINCPDAPDPSREPCCFSAIFNEQSTEQDWGKSNRDGQRTDPPTRTCKPWISLNDCIKACMKKGDRVIRQRDGRIYELIDLAPDGQGRARAHLIDRTPDSGRDVDGWPV